MAADMDIVEYARSLVEDKDLSDEDTRLILEAARNRSQDEPLTQKEIDDILKTVRVNTTSITYEEVPRVWRALAIFLLVFGGLTVVSIGYLAWNIVGTGIIAGELDKLTVTSGVLAIITATCDFAAVVLSVFVGVRLLRGHRGKASVLILVGLSFNILAAICEFMLYGLDFELLDNVVLAVIQLIISTRLNPSLTNEYELREGLRKLDTEAHAKAGTLGLADPGQGFIRLDFFNVFWCFVVCCVLGLIVEIIWHMAVVDPGVYQDRAGLLFGPFSPIYGIGAVLMTVALNRFKDKNVLFLFVICTIIGGGFEYFTSWFMELSFGAKAWDYTHMPTGALLGGRTCLAFASMFGLLGIVWIKLLLPELLKLINMIPWRMRHVVTAICAALMAVNICMTLQSLDNWSERLNGHVPSTPVEQFYADNYGDDVMQERFQSMTITPGTSSRQD